jgi:deoxyguanosine kinase
VNIAHRYIVVEGAIGVGKTSLAKRLATTLGATGGARTGRGEPVPRALLPQSARAGALPAQLYFLFQRAQQLAQLKQQDLFGSVRVADYLLDKDRLFARLTLEDEEYALYEPGL